MKIETRFNIGQEVFIIERGATLEWCTTCGGEQAFPGAGEWMVLHEVFTILQIIFYRDKAYSRADSFIVEYITNSSSRGALSETNLNAFSTKEEAQAECDKRNKEKNHED